MGSNILQVVTPVYTWLVGIMVPWGLILLFVLTFLESIFVVGLFTPGEIVVVASALVAAGSGVSLALIFVLAWVGGTAGLVVGYAIGRRFGLDRLRGFLTRWSQTRLGRAAKVDPAIVDDLVEYFRHHGMLTVMGARFAYGTKSFIPPIAGALQMSFPSFLFSSAVGCGLYTVVLTVVGWLLQRNAATAGRIMSGLGEFAVIALIALIALAIFGVRRIKARRRERGGAQRMAVLRADVREKVVTPEDEDTGDFISSAFWNDVTLFDEVASTNDLAFDAAAQGGHPPLAFIARSQTAGRGRMGRTWSSPRGGLYLSFLLDPRAVPVDASPAELSPAVALAIARVLRRLCLAQGREPAANRIAIKWPNDVFIGDRKVAGILLEQRGAALVVGIGINVRRASSEINRKDGVGLFAPSTAPAGFVSDLGIEVGRRELARHVLDMFERVYGPWSRDGFAAIAEEYAGFEMNLGTRVSIHTADGTEMARGFCVGFGPHGEMLVGPTSMTLPAEALPVVAGEVSLRPLSGRANRAAGTGSPAEPEDRR